ncbi:MAG: hypothetical protein KKF50_00695 [Nanoarchaeota archaeon]|nr:hypothetical protein [Nanoarchaeota archaeon]
MAVRRNEFQEITYAIFSLFVFGMLASIMIKDISIASEISGLIRVLIFIGFIGLIFVIFKKIFDIFN